MDGGPVVPLATDDIHLAAHLFVPSRLRLARELRGYTRIELADPIGKTPAAVSQFESARHRPEPRTLGKIALVLGVPVGFFARALNTSVLSLDACHFRSVRSASQRSRRALLAWGTLLTEVVALVEEFVELPAEQVSGVATETRSPEDIEDCALRVRQAWGLGLGPIPNIVRLLESKGIIVSCIPEGCEDVDAFSVWHEGRPMVFLVTEKGSTSRTRFDAAHELAHLVMHADVSPGDPDREREAHRFAAAFLVPREPFLQECPRRLSLPHFYELKRRWRVSVAALVRRAFDLDILTEASYRRAFVQLSQRGERLDEPDEPPVEIPTLLHRAVSEAEESCPRNMFARRLGLAERDFELLVAGGRST